MNEDRYRREVMAGLKGHKWKVQDHEDMFHKFIPDVSFSVGGKDGWIELKYVQKFPRTLGHIEHYTTGQQEWLMTRGAAGAGHCYLWVGTPHLHVVWHYKHLRKIRDMPFADAFYLASVVQDDIGEVCARLAAVVQRSG